MTVYKETTGDAFKGFVIIFAGTLDEGDGLELGDVKPTAELWCKYRVGWVTEMEGAMQCEEFPEG